MSTVTVNVSFPKELLKAMDSQAKREARTRSDLLRQATRVYLERRRRWERISAFWQQEAHRAGLKPEDVEHMVAEGRHTKSRK